MPRLLVAETCAEPAADACNDGLILAAVVELAGFAVWAAAPAKIWVGVESAPGAVVVVAQ